MADDKNKTQSSYTAKDIYVLEGLEPVRKRPGMYIGSTGVDGLHHLVWEVFDNSLDEAMAGHAKNIEVALLADNKVRVRDDGRGIPVERHKQTGKSALETVMTTLHAGGKFGGDAYKVSGGLHGVGVSVVNALSIWLKAEVIRDGDIYEQEYERGVAKKPVKKAGKAKGHGTIVTFQPDPEIFKEIVFDWEKILGHLRQQAYLTKGIKIVIKDERNSLAVADAKEKAITEYSFYFEGGLMSYIAFLNRTEEPKHKTIFYIGKDQQDMFVEVALQYVDDLQSREMSFANNIHTVEGGMHLTGFKSAITRTLNDYARKNGFIKEKDDNLSGDDVREGLTVVISVKIKSQELQFEGQTKAKLGNPEARTAVETVVNVEFADWMERNPLDARQIMEKVILASKARLAAKAARETVLRKGAMEGLTLPGKLADCSSRDPSESELFIVEGDSAGGCLAGDTKIALLDGRNISFKELTEEHRRGKQNYCYTIKKDGHIGVAQILNPRITCRNAEVLKIILDNKEEIICTPDHKFLLKNEEYKEAKSLTKYDSLMPLYRKISEIGGRITITGYEMVFNPAENYWRFTHVLSDKYNLENNIYSQNLGDARHHKDFNKLNNNPGNLVRIPKQKNSELLNQVQKEYWADGSNRKAQAERVKKFFEENPERKAGLSDLARRQWKDLNLRQWRSAATKRQWTPDFRKKRKEAYNATYLAKALRLMKEIFENKGFVGKEIYNRKRLYQKDKSLIKYETVCERFFDSDEKRMFEAVRNYNHKVVKVEKLNTRIPVYDIEVPETHNFALASGIFVHNSSKQGRDRRTQAILPLKGKILNVEKARVDKMLAHQEIRALIIALGTAIAEEFDLSKLRYHKVVIMTDADVDGAHIRTLLLTLFFRYFPQIIDGGYLYIAQPPLYKIQKSGKSQYAYNDAEKDKIMEEFRKLSADGGQKIKSKNGKVKIEGWEVTAVNDERMAPVGISEEESSFAEASEDAKAKIAGVSIQRYKGLGEMNPDQLWETTLDPQNRVLLQVAVKDAQEADRVFDVLMGAEVLPRKKFIQTHAKSVQNLDI